MLLKLQIAIIYTLCIFLSWNLVAFASKWEEYGYKDGIIVEFSENEHTAISNNPAEKYSAKVTVFRIDNRECITTHPKKAKDWDTLYSCFEDRNNWTKVGVVRGSTLPNPYYYYRNTVKSKGILSGTTQHEVKQIVEKGKWLSLCSSEEAASNQEIVHLLKVFTTYMHDYFSAETFPIILDGVYSFKPSYGNAYKEHYSPWAFVLNRKCIGTLMPNPKQKNEKKACGIWIHKGRWGGYNRDSEGCLTIHPDDWEMFICDIMPDVEEWHVKNLIGEVRVIRVNVLQDVLEYEKRFDGPSAPSLKIVD